MNENWSSRQRLCTQTDLEIEETNVNFHFMLSIYLSVYPYTFFSRLTFRTTEARSNLVPQHEGRRETLGTRSLRISHTWTSKFAGFLLKTRKHEISSGVRTARGKSAGTATSMMTVSQFNNDARLPNLYYPVLS